MLSHTERHTKSSSNLHCPSSLPSSLVIQSSSLPQKKKPSYAHNTKTAMAPPNMLTTAIKPCPLSNNGAFLDAALLLEVAIRGLSVLVGV
jgi:hypothetical protein